jgi:hypothetical protein
MKLRRVSTWAAAIAIAATAIGVVGAGTAKANGPTPLCIYDSNICGYAHGSDPVEMIPQISSTTNWYYPGLYATAQIRQDNTTNCMQVDHDGGNVVIEAACKVASYQEWYDKGINVSGYIYYQFQSEWDPSLCLTYDASASGSILKVGGCGNDWYQTFVGP